MTSTAASAPVRSLQLLALALLALLHSANAATDVLQGDIHLMDSVNQISNYTNLKAGQSYVAIFQVDAQPSNATIGTVFGFCTVLRDVGPSQCQYTIQLASGSVQFAGLLYYPSTEGFNSLTAGLLGVTGGTGLYTGASGYWQTLAPKASQLGTKVPPNVNGFTLSINY